MNQSINWSPGVTLESVEKQAVQAAYTFYKGNKTATANSLGIAIRTLDAKLEKYKADDVSEKERADHELAKRTEFLRRQRGGVGSQSGVQAPETPAGTDVHSTDAGIRMESAPHAPAKPSVPLPERTKVQGVLPSQVSQGRHARGR